tara:strand:- start:410 stop:565 length:156 start_codon:yes stop_codon:yes gene_type:complete
MGVGFGLIHFPFSSHAPVPKGVGVWLLNPEGSGQQPDAGGPADQLFEEKSS